MGERLSCIKTSTKLLILLMFCTLIYSCTSGQEEELCGPEVIVDESIFKTRTSQDSMINILKMDINKDCLSLEIGYSGCNGNHEIDLVVGSTYFTDPPVIIMSFRDKNPQDCEAYFTEEYKFDLSSFGQTITTTGDIVLTFSDQGQSINWQR